MKSQQSKKSQVASWVRYMLLTVPAIKIEGLRAAFERSKLPHYLRPNPADIVTGWKQLKDRWGIAGPEEVPQSRAGLNVSALMRKYIDKFGADKTEKDAAAYFLEDRIELKYNTFAAIKSTYIKGRNGQKVEQAATVPEVKKTRKMRKVRKTREVTEPLSSVTSAHTGMLSSSQASYEEIEVALDKLIGMAGNLNNHPLFNDLRTARRRASAAILG